MNTDNNKILELQNKFFAAWRAAQADRDNLRVIIETDKVLSSFYSHGVKYTENLYYMIDGAELYGATHGNWVISTSEGNCVFTSAKNVAPFALKTIARRWEHITNIYNDCY